MDGCPQAVAHARLFAGPSTLRLTRQGRDGVFAGSSYEEPATSAARHCYGLSAADYCRPQRRSLQQYRLIDFQGRTGGSPGGHSSGRRREWLRESASMTCACRLAATWAKEPKKGRRARMARAMILVGRCPICDRAGALNSVAPTSRNNGPSRASRHRVSVVELVHMAGPVGYVELRAKGPPGCERRLFGNPRSHASCSHARL